MMKALNFTQNRELSWLRFNERVLQEAADSALPLYERLKFVSIFTTNLDEFFRVRIGKLAGSLASGREDYDQKTGDSAAVQMKKISASVRLLYRRRDAVFSEITNRFRDQGIFGLDFAELGESEKCFVSSAFDSFLSPVLLPRIVGRWDSIPFLPNKQLCAAVEIDRGGEPALGLIPMPEDLPEILFLPGGGIRWILTENILLAFADRFFPSCRMTGKGLFCLTRSADIALDTDVFGDSSDIRDRMRRLIERRKTLAPVRLEVSSSLGSQAVRFLLDRFSLSPELCYMSHSPLCMSYIERLPARFCPEQKERFCTKPIHPRLLSPKSLAPDRDLLLFYPFDSMEPFLTMIQNAAGDRDVLSIQITLYRLAKNARLAEALCKAAENGKKVVVLIELWARFDEENNIDWSEKLEFSGCTVLYGFDRLKVHAKICLITRRSSSGALHYTTQIGTGNYHEKTAEEYTDLSLITENWEIGADAAAFFRNMASRRSFGEYRRLLAAPDHMKQKLLSLIENETTKKSDGLIVMKVNSVTDMDVILKLREASRSGVKIYLFVRSACCILPGVPGETENLKVISIVGRFLEHSRIFSFGKGGEQKIYISSADLMTRNLERRVEIACPILSPAVKRKINHIFWVLFRDTVKSRALGPDGRYVKISGDGKRIDSQAVFLCEAGADTAEKNRKDGN